MKPIYRCRVCGAFTEDQYHCGKQAELLLDPGSRVRLSKLMSGLLRYYPWEAGLELDREGWIPIDDLVYGIKYKWRNRELYQWIRREHVVAIALLDPKDMFELRNNRIRARYGHSIKVDIKYRREYPQKLYHGTSTNKLNNILRKEQKMS